MQRAILVEGGVIKWGMRAPAIGESASGTAVAQIARPGAKPHDKDIPIASFVDDLERKKSLKQVMGRPGRNKFSRTGILSEQDEPADDPDDDELDDLYKPSDDQFTKEDVNYRYSGKPDSSCGSCRYFIEPGACQIVNGLIRPVDVCDKFEPGDKEEPGSEHVVRAKLVEESDKAGTSAGAAKGWQTRKGGGGATAPGGKTYRSVGTDHTGLEILRRSGEPTVYGRRSGGKPFPIAPSVRQLDAKTRKVFSGVHPLTVKPLEHTQDPSGKWVPTPGEGGGGGGGRPPYSDPKRVRWMDPGKGRAIFRRADPKRTASEVEAELAEHVQDPSGKWVPTPGEGGAGTPRAPKSKLKRAMPFGIGKGHGKGWKADVYRSLGMTPVKGQPGRYEAGTLAESDVDFGGGMRTARAFIEVQAQLAEGYEHKQDASGKWVPTPGEGGAGGGSKPPSGRTTDDVLAKNQLPSWKMRKGKMVTRLPQGRGEIVMGGRSDWEHFDSAGKSLGRGQGADALDDYLGSRRGKSAESQRTVRAFIEVQAQVVEVSPPGFEKVVKRLKDEPGVDNPWAVAWSMKGKGAQPKDSEAGTSAGAQKGWATRKAGGVPGRREPYIPTSQRDIAQQRAQNRADDRAFARRMARSRRAAPQRGGSIPEESPGYGYTIGDQAFYHGRGRAGEAEAVVAEAIY